MKDLRSPSVITLMKPSKNIKVRDAARAMYSRLYGLISRWLGEDNTSVKSVPKEPTQYRDSDHDCSRRP